MTKGRRNVNHLAINDHTLAASYSGLQMQEFSKSPLSSLGHRTHHRPCVRGRLGHRESIMLRTIVLPRDLNSHCLGSESTYLNSFPRPEEESGPVFSRVRGIFSRVRGMKLSSFRASEWPSYATYANRTTLVNAAYPLESSNQKSQFSYGCSSLVKKRLC